MLSYASLQVQWQYRTSMGGYWNTGGNVETIFTSAPWTKKIYSITPPGTAVQVRVRYRFSYNCVGGGQICNYRANIDDFRLGWDGCM